MESLKCTSLCRWITPTLTCIVAAGALSVLAVGVIQTQGWHNFTYINNANAYIMIYGGGGLVAFTGITYSIVHLCKKKLASPGDAPTPVSRPHPFARKSLPPLYQNVRGQKGLDEHFRDRSFRSVDSSHLFPIFEGEIPTYFRPAALSNRDLFEGSMPLIQRSPFTMEVISRQRFSTNDPAWGPIQSAQHLFVTGISPVLFAADFLQGAITPYPPGAMRLVLLSNTPRPCPYMRAMCQVAAEAKEGRLNPGAISEEHFRNHLIFHLTAAHRIPSYQQMQHLSREEAIALINRIDDISTLQNIAVEGICLEAYCNIYLEQMRNEFDMLEGCCEQGYVYTIHPQNGLLSGDATLTLALQALALKQVRKERLLPRLKIIAVEDENFAWFGGQAQYLPGLYQDGLYTGPPGYTLVWHSYEDPGARDLFMTGKIDSLANMEEYVGCCSTAAATFHFMRPWNERQLHVRA
ncbi:MAG: hypothetical protein ACKVOH_00355 [Chlamydiales bacterium]